jgi:hypothetical protein
MQGQQNIKSFQEYSSTRTEEYKIIQNKAINKEVS